MQSLSEVFFLSSGHLEFSDWALGLTYAQIRVAWPFTPTIIMSAPECAKSSITSGGLIRFYFLLLFYSIWFFFCIHEWVGLIVIKCLSHINLSIVTSQAQLQKSNSWNILSSLIQKLKVFFLPNVSHMKGPWKHKKEFKRINTNTNKEKVRNGNHSSGDRKKKEKKEKKR